MHFLLDFSHARMPFRQFRNSSALLKFHLSWLHFFGKKLTLCGLDNSCEPSEKSLEPIKDFPVR